jgi:hypothetical protein
MVLATLSLVLLVWCVHLSTRTPAAASVAGVRDRGREAAEVAEMVSASSGVWDSHPDADVSRVLQPNLEERSYQRSVFSSNRFGMNERDYELPKPADTVRVVLLGDSFIFGQGVENGQRLGALLERNLSDRSDVRGRSIEVLHLGIPSWNLVAECSFLRRQLSLLRPDLVVHVSVNNDLADTTGVRGMGSMGRFVPRDPSQGDTVVRQDHARWALNAKASGHLARGLDHESRARFEEAGEHIERLSEAVERVGGRYLHVFSWVRVNAAAAAFLAPHLREEQVAWLPASFSTDPEVRLSVGDPHWNPDGHAQMARYLYGLIQDRDLLPDLDVRDWPEARELAQALHAKGEREATSKQALEAQRNARTVPSELDMADRTAVNSSLVHGGVDADGTMGPYASVMLSRQSGDTLRVTGSCLERPEMDGGRLEVFIDEIAVAVVPIVAGERVDLSLPLPDAVADRPWISVRFVADDFVYTGKHLRQCASFRLQRVAIEP